MAIVTYLFGAGASAKSLPCVNDMANTAHSLWAPIHNLGLKIGNAGLKKYCEEVVADIKTLKEECGHDNFSIDTYAKQLYIRDQHQEYSALKKRLALFFTLIQKLKPIDNRYDNFWAALLDRPTSFPKDIRIVSWNYDNQFELSYQKFSGQQDLHSSSALLNSLTPYSNTDMFEPSTFGLVKLNGTAKY